MTLIQCITDYHPLSPTFPSWVISIPDYHLPGDNLADGVITGDNPECVGDNKSMLGDNSNSKIISGDK